MVQVSFPSFTLLLQLHACVCLNSGMCTRTHRGPQRSRDAEHHEARVTGGCELSNMGFGN